MLTAAFDAGPALPPPLATLRFDPCLAIALFHAQQSRWIPFAREHANAGEPPAAGPLIC